MSMLQSAVASVALTAALLSSAASADTFAYVANADSNDINVFRVEPANGKIEAVETVAFPGVEKAGLSTPLAVSPDRHFLFAGVRAEPYVVLSCHRCKERPSLLSRPRPACRQHGEHRHGSFR